MITIEFSFAMWSPLKKFYVSVRNSVLFLSMLNIIGFELICQMQYLKINQFRKQNIFNSSIKPMCKYFTQLSKMSHCQYCKYLLAISQHFFAGDACSDSTYQTTGTGCQGGAVCLRGLCVCPMGYVAMPLVKACVRILAQPGFSCAQGEKCCDRSECIHSVCTCAPSHTQQDRSCLRSDLIGSSFKNALPLAQCNEITLCTGGSVCADGVCRCPTGQTLVGHRCTVTSYMVAPGFKCFPASLCTGGSVCLNGECVCPPGDIIDNDKCVPEEMEVPVVPAYDIGGHILFEECSGPACQAKLLRAKQEKPLAKHGSPCVEHKQCTPGAKCRLGLCQCVGAISAAGSCVGKDKSPGVAIFPGGPCTSDSICTGGSSCIDGHCVCPEGMVIGNDHCVNYMGTVLPGDPCPPGVVCGGGAICLHEVCVCPPGTQSTNSHCVNSGNKRRPGKTANPGSPCAVGITACTGGSNCVQGKCSCSQGQIVSNQRCVSTTYQLPPGSSCNAGCTRCGISCGGGSFCESGVCACPLGQESLNDVCQNTGIIPEVPPGSQCNIFSRCGGGSLCEGGVCVCPVNTVPVNNACVIKPIPPGPGPGESVLPGGMCNPLTSVCTGGSVCNGGYCQCPDQTVLFVDRCLNAGLTAKPGSPCDFGTICIGGSFCNSLTSQCTCPTGQVPDGTGALCIPNVIIVPATTAGPLIPIPIGGPCSETSQCSGNSICDEGRCQCAPGTISVKNVCLPGTVLPGMKCILPQACSGGAVCLNSFCTCPQGQIISNQKCTTQPGGGLNPPGSSCTMTQQCGGGSSCINGRCLCPIGQVVANGPDGQLKCVQATVNPGEICTRYSQCIGGSSCQGGICVCPAGRIVQNGQCITNPIVIGGPGSQCRDIRDCIGRSTCQSGICNCAPNQIWMSGFCTDNGGPTGPGGGRKGGGNIGHWPLFSLRYDPYNPPLPPFVEKPVEKLLPKDTDTTNQLISAEHGGYPGEACSNLAGCVLLASCINGFCQCNQGLVPYNGRCVGGSAQVPPGSWCGGKVVCGGGSYCYNNRCQCPYGQLMRDMECVAAPIGAVSNLVCVLQLCYIEILFWLFLKYRSLFQLNFM